MISDILVVDINTNPDKQKKLNALSLINESNLNLKCLLKIYMNEHIMNKTLNIGKNDKYLICSNGAIFGIKSPTVIKEDINVGLEIHEQGLPTSD